MHFCSECGNMYYVRISEDDDNKLIYYCRKCGHLDDIITEENKIEHSPTNQNLSSHSEKT